MRWNEARIARGTDSLTANKKRWYWALSPARNSLWRTELRTKVLHNLCRLEAEALINKIYSGIFFWTWELGSLQEESAV